MFCPKMQFDQRECFSTSLAKKKKKNIEKRLKNYYLLNRVKQFLKLKGFNFDVMLIEQVVVFFNALNDFFDSDKRNKILHSKN